jgi:hypothetical protein
VGRVWETDEVYRLYTEQGLTLSQIGVANTDVR